LEALLEEIIAKLFVEFCNHTVTPATEFSENDRQTKIQNTNIPIGMCWSANRCHDCSSESVATCGRRREWRGDLSGFNPKDSHFDLLSVSLSMSCYVT
jgi:hypothetical protein